MHLLRKWSVVPPKDTTIVWASISPRGDRIAWNVTADRTPPWAAWLHRRVSAFPLNRQPPNAIWVSRLDGSEMHEIGPVTIYGKVAQNARVLSGLQWLPGGC